MIETLLSGRVVLRPGDCLDVLAQLDENSLDACVTDPPYALAFMGKAWDHAAVAFDPATWALVHRLLKPGGHLLAMGGTRTYHRLVCAIEDAGFEIRDTISWLYGSGFPKSHDVSKGIDRAAGAEREKTRTSMGPTGNKYCKGLGDGRPWMEEAAVNGFHEHDSDIPATDAARQWDGWGTALKPACELIVLARKPLSEGTVAANVLRWGTGAINVDGCRVAATDKAEFPAGIVSKTETVFGGGNGRYADNPRTPDGTPTGRWPANVAHDGSDEVTAAFPESNSSQPHIRGSDTKNDIYGRGLGEGREGELKGNIGDTGSAARFFFTAKADADDRLGSKHPTVKPLDLMQWLVRMVCPKGGTVLDPFAGTGTTGEAAWREGMRAVLIEAEPEYQADIRRRMALVLAGPDERQRESIKAKNLPRDDGPLFADEWRKMWSKPFDFSQEPKGNPT